MESDPDVFRDTFKAHHELFEARKHKNETLAQWAARLTRLGEEAGYDDMDVLDMLLRDKFLTGLDPSPIMDYFEKRPDIYDFTYKQILDIAFTVAAKLDREAREKKVAKEVSEHDAKEEEARGQVAKKHDFSEHDAKEEEARGQVAKKHDVNEEDAKEVESKEAAAKEVETKEAEAKEVETKEAEAKEVESKETEAKEVDTKEAEAKEVETKEEEAKVLCLEALEDVKDEVKEDDASDQEAG